MNIQSICTPKSLLSKTTPPPKPPSPPSPTLFTLQRYPLCAILSYLTEQEGIIACSTCTFSRKKTLPLFKLPTSLMVVNDSARVEKYRFRECPCQDASVLLARVNTRRLKGRLLLLSQQQQQQHNKEDEKKEEVKKAYEYNMETTQLAKYEWDLNYYYFHQKDIMTKKTKIWPSTLELLRFLNDASPSTTPKQNPVTLLCSYPRSGNTLLRTLLERTTSILTGSDTRPDRSLSKSLAHDHDVVGEGIISSTQVSIVKTHFPERRGCLPYRASKVLLVIRNPYDVIDSYWNLCVTNTHTQTASQIVYDLYKDKFEGMAKSDMVVWCAFHEWWLKKCKEDDGIELCIVRYEDLILNMEVELARIVQFVLGGEEEEGEGLNDFWLWRVRHALSTNNTANLGSYKPRAATNGSSSIGKSLGKNRYPPHILRQMHDNADKKKENDNEEEEGEENISSMLEQFGYHVYKQNFPHNFQTNTPEQQEEEDIKKQMHAIEKACFSGKKKKKKGTVRVNVGPEIRIPDDPYGRAMTAWRKQETDDGNVPFPTEQRGG